MVATVAGGLGVAVVPVLLVPVSWWPVVWHAVAGRWPVVVVAVVSVALLAVGGAAGWRDVVALVRRSGPADTPSTTTGVAGRSLRPIPFWMIPAGAVLVGAITWAAVWVLQGSVPAGGDEVERAKLRVETIRTGLSAGAGAAAALALLLAFRRQQVAEYTHLSTEYDAGERRITELYVKAAEQLGSDKAPVRLAGLYALERLAQDNPPHRQSIVEVICAYLRMPYTPPDEEQQPAGQDNATATVEGDPATSTTQSAVDGESDKHTRDPREERQVRLAAQRILARHLRPTTTDGTPDPVYWGPRILDLTEATLIDIDFGDCTLHRADFNGATFTGIGRFGGARFTGDAWFVGTRFTGVAILDQAAFDGDARFVGATFTGDARFDGATFTGDARFDEATFTGDARFDEATFTGSARFAQATFTGSARFAQATFAGAAGFVQATFTSDAYFGITTFAYTRFDEATFTGDATFDRATFTGTVSFEGATFTGDARFNMMTFTRTASFEGTTFASDANFGGVAVGSGDRGGDVWPEGWRVDEVTWRLVRDAPDQDPDS